jgi:diacylglycerol O-acyltransferase / trehalose O-mycolyltransferase / mycolyltransferase Ag85
MRRALLVLVAIALSGCGSDKAAKPVATPTATPSGPAVVAQQRVDARTLDLVVRSPALGRTAKVRLLLPDGWDRAKQWPVLYLLHGCCDTYDSWTRETDVADLPQLRNVLVVLPEGGAFGFYSDWQKGPKWETFHLEELRGLLESDFGAGPRRAIAGLSMGGYGALAYAARHPGMFGAAASYSGVVHPAGDPALIDAIGQSAGEDAAGLWGDPKTDKAVWDAHDPTVQAKRLRGTRLFVSIGDRGEVERSLRPENEALAAALKRAHVPATLDFYERGTHDWPYWQRELHRSLPTLLAGLK